jgi:hypothetical protein
MGLLHLTQLTHQMSEIQKEAEEGSKTGYGRQESKQALHNICARRAYRARCYGDALA